MLAKGFVTKLFASTRLTGRGKRLLFLKSHIAVSIREKIEELGQDAVMLPPVNYGIDKDSCKTFSYTEDKENLIIDASVQYGYTCV